MKKTAKGKTLALEIDELIDRYVLDGLREWILKQDELVTKFGDKPKRR